MEVGLQGLMAADGGAMLLAALEVTALEESSHHCSVAFVLQKVQLK